MKNALVVFAAGCFAGLIKCLVMYMFSRYGLTHSLNVNIHASLNPQWMYPQIVWGGIWGFLFLLPVLSTTLFVRSFVLGLIPTCVQLFIIYPYYEGKGVAGLTLGLLTPFVVMFYCWVWALSAAVILKIAK